MALLFNQGDDDTRTGGPFLRASANITKTNTRQTGMFSESAVLVTAIAFTCFLLTQALGIVLLLVLLTILLFAIVPLVITDLAIRTAKLMVCLLDLFTDPDTIRKLSPFNRFRR